MFSQTPHLHFAKPTSPLSFSENSLLSGFQHFGVMMDSVCLRVVPSPFMGVRMRSYGHSSLVLPVLGIVDHSKQAPDHAKEAVKGILNNLDGCLDVYQGTMPSPPCYSFLNRSWNFLFSNFIFVFKLCICACKCVCPLKARGGHQGPWSWCYSWL